MHRVISVDGGNTKLKLGLISTDFKSIEESLETDFAQFNQAVSTLFKKYTIQSADLALTSVVQSTKDFVLEYAESDAAILDFHYVTAKENNVLSIEYNRQKLGSDRLAAAIAARYLFDDEEIIIVDSGTATKVDMVKGNSFIGGFILPGIGIKAQSLYEKTDKLPKTDVYNIHYSHCPTETNEAIESGIIIDSVGGIEKAIQICKKSLQNPKIIASGGGWDILQNYINTAHIETVPNIALLGAGISLKRSQDK